MTTPMTALFTRKAGRVRYKVRGVLHGGKADNPDTYPSESGGGSGGSTRALTSK